MALDGAALTRGEGDGASRPSGSADGAASAPVGEIIVGRIFTGTARGWVEAIGLAGGRVVRAGAETDVRAHMAPGSTRRRVEVLVPGFVDSHIHVLWMGRGANQLDVSGETSIADVLASIERHARSLPPGEWILGDAGFDENQLAEGRMPTVAELDSASAGHPLVLGRRAHDALANSAGLRLAGVTAQTPDPVGGHIERDAHGRPTGLLLERPAAALVESAVPPPDPDAAAGWIEDAQTVLRGEGITAVADPALTPAEIGHYVHAYRTGRLRLRTTVFPLATNEVTPEELEDAVAATGIYECDPSVLRVGPVKIFVDGAGALGNALRHSPWPGTTSVGIQTTPTSVIQAYADWAWRTGRGVGVHTVGSRAVEIALDCFERASGGAAWPTGRVHLIHAYLEQPAELMERARRLGVGAAVQPALNRAVAPEVRVRLGADVDIVGAARWIASGVVCGGGSDGPGVEYDPLVFIAELESEIGRDRAVRFFTGDAAAIIGAPCGTLDVGGVADYVELTGPWRAGQPPERAAVVSSLDLP